MFPRALEESATRAGRRRLRGARRRTGAGLALLALAWALTACGSEERQDASEPSGDFPVQVAKAKFPSHQTLAETSDLQLEISNAGDQTIPNLAVTIYTGDSKAGVTATGSGQGSFNTPVDQPGLANPNRPVWILEHKYPKLLTPGVTVEHLDRAPSAGAAAAQTDTFQFGPVPAGESKDIVWRVTSVRAGTYTVHYEVAAGLQGKARAVSANGGPVKGDFVATISEKPPRTCVNDAGQVTKKCGT